MTDENQQDQDTSAETTSAVRVPNVSPGAVSGLDHSPLGSDTEQADVDLDATEGTDDGVVGLEVPLPDEVTKGEPDDVEGSKDGTDPDAADQATTGSDDGTQAGNVVASDPLNGDQTGQDVPGQLVESETAGTGEAVNAETGETTAPGEPLPTIEQDGGTPLDAQVEETTEQPDSTITDGTVQHNQTS